MEALTAKIHEGLAADLLITSAGVSRGDYDVVKDVLMREGEIDFWTVAMKPGKPLAFGSFQANDRRVPHIGLPGNPVSSMVAFDLFGRPAMMKMMGKNDSAAAHSARYRGRADHEPQRPAIVSGALHRDGA